eukprot:CAMPEP_0168193362 /NCGR_PEP_ID=MMETSP0139_2-20121125/18566_1 /TAXON_ID=44445 /ORGANISM="Pseudo-nitzschia australis, Strain 10249 10 AB" /LENGTH=163 /DNA_ID=CAMNT_0008116713 /DNA_START=47 /DNA_END=538 /DNA_ORIENTATION=-
MSSDADPIVIAGGTINQTMGNVPEVYGEQDKHSPFDSALTMILSNIFHIDFAKEKDHPVPLSLQDADVKTWDDFRELDISDIKQLTTRTATGSRISLVNNLEKQLIVLREFSIHHGNSEDLKRIPLAEIYTYANFSTFRRAQNAGYPPTFWIPKAVNIPDGSV